MDIFISILKVFIINIIDPIRKTINLKRSKLIYGVHSDSNVT